MPNPDLTTEHSEFDAKTELSKFFMARGTEALEQSIAHLRDRDFYASVEAKLSAGVDLTGELPELKGIEAEAPAILKKLRDEAIAASVNCWELKAGAAKVFSTTIRTHDVEGSNISCFDVEYSTQTDAGSTKVHVKTWRRNVEIDVVSDAKAAKAASKKLTLAGLNN